MARSDIWYRRTEKMLYTYPTLDKAIENLEALLVQIDNNKFPSSTAKYGDFGPPGTADKMTEPEKYADRRMASKERIKGKINILRARKAAIEGALERLGEDKRQLVELWYFQRWKLKKKPGNRAIWKELGVSRSTFDRWRNEIVEEVARWLGELVDVNLEG